MHFYSLLKALSCLISPTCSNFTYWVAQKVYSVPFCNILQKNPNKLLGQPNIFPIFLGISPKSYILNRGGSASKGEKLIPRKWGWGKNHTLFILGAQKFIQYIKRYTVLARFSRSVVSDSIIGGTIGGKNAQEDSSKGR